MATSDDDGCYHCHHGQCRHLVIVNQNDDDEMDNNQAKHHYYHQQISTTASGNRTVDNRNDISMLPPLNTPLHHLYPPSTQCYSPPQSRLSLTKIHQNYNCKLDCMFVPVIGRILSIYNQRLQSSLSFSLIAIIMATVVGGVFFNKSIINDNFRQRSQHRKPRQRLRQQTRQSIIMNSNKTKPLYNDNHHYHQLQTTKLHRQPDLLFIISSSTSSFYSSTLSVIFHIFLFLFFSQLILSVSSQPYESTSNAITRVINPGDKVDIPCSVVTPGGSVRWALNNSPIPLDSNQRRYWNISNDGKATLTINRVTKMDAGLWECWKLDGDFKIRQKVPIMKIVLSNVPEEPYLEYEGRIITQHGRISARANNIIKINCVIKGMSSLIRSVQWFIGQANYTHQSRLLMEYSAEEDVSLTISVLTLNVSAKFHHEPIVCQISHLSWPNIANVTAIFNVLYPPDFSILREPGFGFPIIEGMDLTFRCEIDANPLSPVIWQRDPDPKISNETMAPIETSPDGTLTISPITLKDIGWYRCTTTNELGFFASIGFFVNVRESTDEMSQLVDQLRSQNPHLTFESNNFHHRSSSDFAFRKVHDHTNRESHFQALANVGGFNNHQPQVSNKPECPPNINNADGRPIIESINSTVIALVGSQITLIARFCCIPRPKKVYWIHRHLAMMPSRIIGRYITRELIMSSNSMNCFTSNFIIDSVKPEDAGDVMFMVLNQKGIDQALVSLNVTFASYSISSNGAMSPTSSGISIYHQQNIHSVTLMLLMVYIATIVMNVICSSSNFMPR